MRLSTSRTRPTEPHKFSGGCPAYSPANSVAVNCGGLGYTTTCGVPFLADDTPCDPGDAIPEGKLYCRTNIKGPEGGYSYPTDRAIAGTADQPIFQVKMHSVSKRNSAGLVWNGLVAKLCRKTTQTPRSSGDCASSKSAVCRNLVKGSEIACVPMKRRKYTDETLTLETNGKPRTRKSSPLIVLEKITFDYGTLPRT
jgi:hypothetical protein